MSTLERDRAAPARPFPDGNPDAVRTRVEACGIVLLWSATADTRTVCEAIAREAAGMHAAFALIWFSPTRHDARELAERLRAEAPELHHAGCSTSGEVTPDGLQEQGVLVLLLPQTHFRVSVDVLEEVHELGMETIAWRARAARLRVLDDAPDSGASGGRGGGQGGGQRGGPGGTASGGTGGESNGGVFAMCLIDSLVYAEEAVTTALDRGLGGVPLIGGSAGDDLAFEHTTQIADGRVYERAALLVIVDCDLPFRVFTDNNFVPTEHRLVVTGSDPDRRIVHEFNAEPAALAYARAIGVDPGALDSRMFASNALVVRVGGEYHCRSIQRLNEDGSLTFFCAIEDGLVLTVSRSEGMVRSARAMLDGVEAEIGPLAAVFGFDCVYRRLDARHRNVVERVETLYREKGFVGFNTYGEQFRSMHINQTLTGIAIGGADAND